MCKCYNDKVASSRMCKRESGENPERYRHCERGAVFKYHWETGKGKQCGTKSGELPYCEIQGFAVYESVFSITIQNFFMCIARESCVSRRPQKAAVFLYISVFWKYMKRGR